MRGVGQLQELAAAVPGARAAASPEAVVHRIVYDSRRVEPGDLFVAVRGANVDGAAYVSDALSRGAAAVAAEQELALPAGIGMLVVSDARSALGDLASASFGRPSEQLRIVGVTGTDGKTTTCRLIAGVLAAAGRRVGWMTTVDVAVGGAIVPSAFGRTTPEAPELHAQLRAFADAGVEDAVIEVSSHGLALDRVRGCGFDAAVFTNLAPEHLDFHGSMEAYAAAKARLFEMLDAPTAKPWSRMGVVNGDDPASVVMATSSPAAIVSYALENVADVTATHLELGLTGSRFRLVTPIEAVDVETRLPGRHNVANWLAAAAVALGWGIPMTAVARAAATTEPPPGRLQRIRRGQPFEVVVDFAHTPQALQATLETLRGCLEGRLSLVFGMAGGRYRANRITMGELAARTTDFFVVTTDDPAPEDPAEIAAEVVAGARQAGAVQGKSYLVELDRRTAIRTALERARPGDVVLLSGKGHEQRMLLLDGIVPWSDQAVAEEILAEMGYR